MSLENNFLNTLFNPKSWVLPPSISREDALRLADQLRSGKTIIVDGVPFVPGKISDSKDAPDKDLLLAVDADDGARWIELSMYTQSNEADVNFSSSEDPAKHFSKQGSSGVNISVRMNNVTIQKLVDADGVEIALRQNNAQK